MEVNRIICGDNVEVMKGMPDACLDMTCQSPPYGGIRLYQGYSFRFRETAEQLFRVMKPGAVCVWVCGDTVERGFKTADPFKQVLGFREVGFDLYDTMIYERTGTSFPTKARYTQCFDFMFIFSKGKPKTINLIRDVPKRWQGAWGSTTQRQKDGSLKPSNAKNNGMGKSGPAVGAEYGYRARDTIWKICNGAGFGHTDELAKQHPASYPEELARGHIETWSLPGEFVADVFNGSGTTTKMAKLLGRQYIGIDCAAEYCAIAEARLKLVEGKELHEEKTKEEPISVQADSVD